MQQGQALDGTGSARMLQVGANQARTFKLATQPEGCVADDRSSLLFVGEEDRGLWVTSARSDQAATLRMVMPVGGWLIDDVEGMGIHHGAKASYLVVHEGVKRMPDGAQNYKAVAGDDIATALKLE